MQKLRERADGVSGWGNFFGCSLLAPLPILDVTVIARGRTLLLPPLPFLCQQIRIRPGVDSGVDLILSHHDRHRRRSTAIDI